MQGIIMAGGSGSRLWPSTATISKHLLHVYDKPLIYYPLSTLFLAGIREIFLITSPRDLRAFQDLLGDGSQFGVTLHFLVQESPNGVADAFLITRERLSGQKVALILGDNLFHGQGLGQSLRTHNDVSGAQIFAYAVSNPWEYGIVTIDSLGKPTSLVEKPTNQTIGNLAVPGLYFYDEKVFEFAEKLSPSQRGELEITDLNRMYLDQGELSVQLLARGTTWLDTGTPEGLHDAATFVQVIEKRQGLKIGCPEEIALRNGWIAASELLQIVKRYENSYYAKYLISLLDDF
jgi:glucose-1-phosphate thymidylyltransferase